MNDQRPCRPPFTATLEMPVNVTVGRSGVRLLQRRYDAAQTIAWPWNVKLSEEPNVLSHACVADSKVPYLRISGDTHFRFPTSMTQPPEGG